MKYVFILIWEVIKIHNFQIDSIISTSWKITWTEFCNLRLEDVTMVLFFNFVISKFGKIFKLVKFTRETKTFPILFQFFCQCVNHNGYLEKDLVREKMIKWKGLNQMKKLSYDTEYQNGQALSLESLNEVPRLLKVLKQKV